MFKATDFSSWKGGVCGGAGVPRRAAAGLWGRGLGVAGTLSAGFILHSLILTCSSRVQLMQGEGYSGPPVCSGTLWSMRAEGKVAGSHKAGGQRTRGRHQNWGGRFWGREAGLPGSLGWMSHLGIVAMPPGPPPPLPHLPVPVVVSSPLPPG